MEQQASMPSAEIAARWGRIASGSLASAASAFVAALAAGAAVWIDLPDATRTVLASGGAPPDLDAAGWVRRELGEVPHVGRVVASFAPSPLSEAAVVLLHSAVARTIAEREWDDARRRLADNERMAGSGSYDWDIRSDTNRWSDELYRLYGYEPGAFDASYDRFLSLVHPEDRDHVQAVHREAYATGRPYQTEERIVRPDGEVRILATTGEVVHDAEGRPARMMGVCLDVTGQRRAELEARGAAARFEAVVESAPDAIVLVGDGVVRQANRQAEALFGHPLERLVGMRLEDLLPPDVRAGHAAAREAFTARPTRRPMAAGQDLFALRADGTLVAVDIGLTPIDSDEGPLIAAFVRDATPRRQAEADRRRADEAAQRRRQALELNDTVVQGLVTLLWTLDDDDQVAARRIAEDTLAAARAMMEDLLTADADALVPGALARGVPAGPARRREPPTREHERDGAIRVVVADDAAEIRLLVALALAREPDLVVVAEAADGEEAVDRVLEHRPDVILLDLGMPKVDGLEAAQRIRSLAPATRIIVLSGHPASVMRERVLAAGALAYLEKTGELGPVIAAVREFGRSAVGAA